MSKYWDKRFRDKEIIELAKELSISELAKKFKVSERTIQRALKEVKNGRRKV